MNSRGARLPRRRRRDAGAARRDDVGGPPATIMLNGKFLSAPPTGVHRVAGALITHLDKVLAQGGQRRRWILLCPKDADGALPLEVIERRRVGRLTWQAWEQLELPGAARGEVLVNLCNLAPLRHRRSVTMIHDAQVFLTPDSYPAPFRAWYRFALPRIGRGSARILTVSDYSRDRLAQFRVASPEKIDVVRNGVDHMQPIVPDGAILARLKLTPGGYVLAAAGAQKHKNVGLLFRAFAAHALRGLALVVAGGDREAAFAAAGAPAPPGTIFAGRTSDAELRALYENAHCLAFPSTTEGFGLPPMEAMSVDCPTIVAPCGALPEVCGGAALYADERDPAAWAAAIQSLYERRLRLRLREAGRVRAALYRWEDSARRLMAIVEGVAERAGRGA